MGNIADSLAEPEGPTCDECGAPLDEENDCTGQPSCLASIEKEE